MLIPNEIYCLIMRLPWTKDAVISDCLLQMDLTKQSWQMDQACVWFSSSFSIVQSPHTPIISLFPLAAMAPNGFTHSRLLMMPPQSLVLSLPPPHTKVLS